MESGTSSWGRAAEALSRTFTNSPDKFNGPLRTMPSLQPRSSPLYSPDTRVFNTPEQHGPAQPRDEGLFQMHRASAHGGQEQAFQDQMDQYALEQLSKEWDGLFLGDSSDDIRSGADICREVRRELRTLAIAMKQSFGLLVDNRHLAGSVQQLQPCINELKSVAKDMASATRMATDNYNLQVELTLQKHASQHLLAQLHEAQLARMALEEEINSLRAEGQRVTATEAQVANLRRLNDELQAEAQQASGELVEVRRRNRELEERLEVQRLHVANLSARLREVEVFEDSGSPTPLGEFYVSSDGGTTSLDSSGLAAVAAALGGAAAAHSHGGQGAEHSCPGGLGAGRAGANGGGGAHEGGGEGGAAAGTVRHVHARDLPPELRRLLGKVLRRRDAEAAKLREDNALLTEELARLRASLEQQHHPLSAQPQALPPAGAATSLCGSAERRGPSSTGDCPQRGAAGAASTLEPSATSAPWRRSADSWHTDDDLDWGTRPVAGEQGHHRTQQRPQQHHRPPHFPHHQYHSTPQLQELQPQHHQYAAELEAARETISRLQAELAEVQERLAAQRKDAETAGVAAEAALRQRLAEAEAASAAHLQAAQQAADRLESERDAAVAERDAVSAERDVLEADLREAKRAAVAAVDAADASAAAAASAALSDAERLVSENDRIAADLAAARQLIASLESQLAASASAHAELQGRLSEAEQRERRERQARDGATKELETTRQRLTRLQADMRDVRAEAQVARGEATAAWRDVKAANSEKLNAQREMEEAVERVRLAEAARDDMAARLTEADAERRRLEEQLGEAAMTADNRTGAAAPPPPPGGSAEAQSSSAERGAVGSLGSGSRSGSSGGAEAAVVAGGPAAAAALTESSSARVAALETALDAARSELAAARGRWVQERRESQEEAGRLRAELCALQSELAAVRLELAAMQADTRERSAALEAAEAEATATAAAAEAEVEKQRSQLAALQQSLTEAQARVADLEGQVVTLRQGAERAAQAQERADALQARLDAAESAVAEAQAVAVRELELRHVEELGRLQARLAQAEVEAAAAVATATAAARRLEEPGRRQVPGSPATSASSSDAGVSAAGSPAVVHGSGGAAAASAPAAGVQQRADGRAGVGGAEEGQEEEDDGDGTDVLVLRARCRSLRGELGLVRSRLAALTEVSEAAAQGRLAEALAEVQQAVAAGRVGTDEEFWAHSEEMHSLYALVAALRATSLYSGLAGTAATYGDTAADGAGSLVGVTSGHATALGRHRLLCGLRQRCGQVAELLSEAAALVQLPRGDATEAGTRGGAASSSASASLGTGAGSHAAAAAHRSSRGGGAPGQGGGNNIGTVPAAPGAVGAISVAAAPAAGRGGTAARALYGGLEHEAQPWSWEHEKCDPYDAHMSGGGARETLSGGGAGGYVSPPSFAFGTDQGHGLLTSAALQPPGASSSFTSDTGSSLADDDLANLSTLYELPPMATPPKFDFDLANLAL